MASMIRVVYTPEGGSKRVWEVDLENPPWDITYGTEKATGWPWVEFGERISKLSVIALQALLYVLRKRDEPRLTLDAVTVSFDEVQLEDPDEDEPEAEAPKETA